MPFYSLTAALDSLSKSHSTHTQSHRLSDSPSPRVGHSFIYLQNSNEAVLFGGASHEEGLKNDTYILNLDSFVWIQVATGIKPPPRYEHGSVLVNRKGSDCIIIFGGCGENGSLNDVWCLNLENMSWCRLETRGRSPSPRALHSITRITSRQNKDRIYIFGGGMDGDQPTKDAEVYCLDIDGLMWIQLTSEKTSPKPSSRLGHTLVASGMDIYVFGGMNSTQSFNELWNFNAETNTWREIQILVDVPSPRSAHSASIIGSEICIIGGMDKMGTPKVFNDVYFYDIANSSWRKLNCSDSAERLDHGACRIFWNEKKVMKTLQSDRKLIISSTSGNLDDIESKENDREAVLIFGGMDLRGIYDDLRVFIP